MDEFLNFNINNVDIGKAVYDHYLRFSGIGTINEFKPEFYVNLSKSLLIYDQVDKYFKKYKIIASVQTEKQFIPGAIIFQSALTYGMNVYSRMGPSNTFAVKKYNNINERYTARARFSKKLYDLINKNIRLLRNINPIFLDNFLMQLRIFVACLLPLYRIKFLVPFLAFSNIFFFRFGNSIQALLKFRYGFKPKPPCFWIFPSVQIIKYIKCFELSANHIISLINFY